MIDIGGVEFDIADAAKLFGVCDEQTARQRIFESNCTVEQALLSPTDEFTELVTKHFGMEVMIDAYEASVEQLTDMGALHRFLHDLPEQIGMTRIHGPEVFEYQGIEPDDYGVTGTVILAESLAAIHTFPKRDGFVTVNVYSCKMFSPYALLSLCKEFFQTDKYDIRVIPRGSRFKRGESRKHEPVEQYKRVFNV